MGAGEGLDRLARALDVACAWRGASARANQDAVLTEHDDLRDLLEPMLCAEPAPEPRRLGGVVLGEELGRGAMGVVYAARQVSLGRDVAVKLLAGAHLASAHARARFQREAELVAGLRHEHVVTIHEVGCEGGVPYLVMEKVDGVPLHQVLDRVRGCDLAKLTGADVARAVGGAGEELAGSWFAFVARLVAQVADALQHAHEAGVVHRDVKPSNVMLRRDGRAVLTDFGLARAERSPALSATGDFAGTPYYLAPEMVRGEAGCVDRRCDVYALGVTLYELLTHRVPFDGVTSHDVLARVLAGGARDPRAHSRAIPRDLAAIALQAMHREPGQRYQSAREFGDDLRAFVAGEPVRARRPGALRRAAAWARRKPSHAALVALLAVGVPASGFALFLQQRAANRVIAAEKGHAEQSLAVAVGAVRGTLAELSAVHLRAVPGMQKVRERFDRTALGFLSRLPADGEPAVLRARVLTDLAGVLLERDAAAEAEATAVQALAALAALPPEPGEAAFRGFALHTLARARARQGRVRDARAVCAAAVAHFETMLRAAPGDRAVLQHVATTSRTLGDLQLAAGDRPAALAAYDRALDAARAAAGDGDDPFARHSLVEVLVNVAWAKRASDRAQAIALLEEALALAEALPADLPVHDPRTALVAKVRHLLGMTLYGGGDYERAEPHLRAAVAGAEAFLAANPDLPRALSDLAARRNDLALALVRLRRPEEALDLARAAVELQERALAATPNVPRYRAYVRNHYCAQVEALLLLDRPGELAAAATRLGEAANDAEFEAFAAYALLTAAAAAGDEAAAEAAAWRQRSVALLVDAEAASTARLPIVARPVFDTLAADAEAAAVVARLRAR